VFRREGLLFLYLCLSVSFISRLENREASGYGVVIVVKRGEVWVLLFEGRGDVFVLW
jgi:hypothetical protein